MPILQINNCFDIFFPIENRLGVFNATLENLLSTITHAYQSLTITVCFRITRPLGYERVYLSLHKVADTRFHIQEDELLPLVYMA